LNSFGFSVIDTKTGKEPNREKIVLTEEWAKHLIYCDVDGFYISEDGSLILVDDCGNIAYCPPNRFEIIFEGQYAVKEKKVLAKGMNCIVEANGSEDNITDLLQAEEQGRLIEIVFCRDCRKIMTPDCPMCSFTSDGYCEAGPNSDGYCFLGEK